MQKLYTILFFSLLITFGLQAQVSFSDNFDSYPAGTYLGTNNSAWTTWSGKPGTNEDAKVTSDQSKSPDNSIYITATSNDGGPMDLVLPFGEKFTKGTFILKMSLYIPKGNTTYFNLQANQKIGEVWALETRIAANGIMELTTGARSVLATKVPVGEWFEIELNINLSANLWSVLINDECRGAFVNLTNANSVSSLNFYPTDRSCSYYVDDVSFEHTPSANTVDVDASLVGFTWSANKLLGSTDSPVCYIQNNGIKVINSAEVVFSVSGHDDEVYELTDLNLKRGERSLIYLPEITLQEGPNLMTISITKVNDQDGDDVNCNNVLSNLIDPIIPAAHKRVLVEEATGTWCVWCPRGAVFMDRFDNDYHNLFIPIAVHGGSSTEPMRMPEYVNFLGFNAFPNCRVERGGNIDPSGVEDPFLANIVKAPVAKLETGAQLDQGTNTLDVSVEVEYLENGSGTYYVSLVLTEDDVRGTTSAYNQANAYAGGGQGAMGGYESLPNPVPASRMVYNHVARVANGLQRTPANTINGSVDAGSKHFVHFSVKLDNAWKKDKINIIPILMKGNEVMNVNTSSIDKAIAYGYTTSTKEIELDAQLTVYPNPADDHANIEFSLAKTSDVTIDVYNMDGSIGLSKTFGQQSGQISLKMPVESLTSGIYLMKINTNEGSKYGKIVINR